VRDLQARQRREAATRSRSTEGVAAAQRRLGARAGAEVRPAAKNRAVSPANSAFPPDRVSRAGVEARHHARAGNGTAVRRVPQRCKRAVAAPHRCATRARAAPRPRAGGAPRRLSRSSRRSRDRSRLPRVAPCAGAEERGCGLQEARGGERCGRRRPHAAPARRGRRAAAGQLVLDAQLGLRAPHRRRSRGGATPSAAAVEHTTPDRARLTPLLLFAQVIVGSCPKCAADVHRIADESPATAILCLQARGPP